MPKLRAGMFILFHTSHKGALLLYRHHMRFYTSFLLVYFIICINHEKASRKLYSLIECFLFYTYLTINYLYRTGFYQLAHSKPPYQCLSLLIHHTIKSLKHWSLILMGILFLCLDPFRRNLNGS